ncbi:MAG: hypothetical protein ACRDF0_02015, partial [Candidatus Limnocylindria bacterium]
GDVEGAAALVAADAPVEFRAREIALAEIAAKGTPLVPRSRTPVDLLRQGDLWELQAGEVDDQGRVRRVRYFAAGPLDALRLSEPTAAALGEALSLPGERFETRARLIDAAQCQLALRYSEEALVALLGRLGEAYRPERRIVLNCSATVVPGLPVLASAYVRDAEITFLTSQSMVVFSDPGAQWARTVAAHELAHVLLFQRGTGPFFLIEGIPLWLTDDRRQNELDRLVAADALWTLEHLVEGPRDATEFFAAYAQAQSFVRFIATAYGDSAVIDAWEAGRTMPFADAFRSATGATPGDAYAAWRASLRR